MMFEREGTAWQRDTVGLGVWEGRGKVSIQGWGMSPMDRRWDGVSMDKTLGAYAILAAQRALEDAGVKPEEVDGLLVCPDNAEGTGGPSGSWGPTRPYFAPPYDSEEGLSIITGKWVLNNWPELTNVEYAPVDVPDIGKGLGMTAEALLAGRCNVAVYIYGMVNLEGRYRRGGEANISDDATGSRVWTFPWGMSGGNQFSNTFAIQQYCTEYGTTWDQFLGPFVVNQHRNGRMNPWSFYSLHEQHQLTIEDYLTSRHIVYPVRIWDCDRPCLAVGAFVLTTGERAKDMKQKPVYMLNHTEGRGGGARSSQEVMTDLQGWASLAAQMAYEGSGLTPSEVDIFNPYDGYSGMTPFWLEGFQWHGVKEGDAHAFFNDDIRVEGPHPFSSSGGNLGNGRSRTSMYIDSIEQLRGTAGKRQVTVKAETAICAYAPTGSLAYVCLANSV